MNIKKVRVQIDGQWVELTEEGVTNSAASSIATVTIELNGSAPIPVTVGGDGSFSHSLTLVEGTSTIVVTATDLASKSSTVTRTVNVITAGPVVSNINIVPNPVNVGQSYVITVEVEEGD